MSEGALVLGRYRLDQRIATGGTAEVWRAHDTQLERDVAVKLLHAHLLPDATSRARLEAEARSVAALSHPGIVAIYDVEVGGERPAIVFELVDGESLATRIAREDPLPANEVTAIGADVADALFHAHQRGVVHRDVKPSNILLDQAGHARLVDFGIAHSLEAAAERLTLAGTIIGTPRYMAPEQLADGQIGPRTDLYALGAVLYEALAGHPAWESASPVAIAAAQRGGPPPLTDVDPALEAIVRACMAHDPEARPRTAGVLAAELRDWQPATVVSPAPPAGDETVVSSVVPRDVAAAPAADAARARDRRTPVLLTLGAAAVLVLALGAGAMLRGTGPSVPPASGSPSATPTPIQTATPDPTPTPAPTLDIGTLPRPVQEEIDRYREACGRDAPLPDGIETMNKKQAEEALEPLRKACDD